MSAKQGELEDSPVAPPAVLKALVDLTRAFGNLQRDLELLRFRIDHNDKPTLLAPAIMSALLFATEATAALVRMQIVLADEGDE